MKIIIPAAGFGKRLRPFTYIIPKPLLYIGKLRIIDYILECFNDLSISQICIITGFMDDVLKQNLGNKFNYIKQYELNGLADAVYMALEDNNEDILIWLSDTLIDIELQNHYDYNWIAVNSTDNPDRFGIVFNENGIIKSLIEKPKNIKKGDAIVGVYYFKEQYKLKKAIEYIFENNIKTNNEYQLTDAIDYMIKNNSEIRINRVNEWYDCGTFDDIIRTHKALMKKEKIYYNKGNIINSDIDKYTSIFDNAKIINSKIRNCIIYEDAYIENAVLHNSIIGRGVIIKNFNGKTIIPHYSLIDKEVK